MSEEIIDFDWDQKPVADLPADTIQKEKKKAEKRVKRATSALSQLKVEEMIDKRFVREVAYRDKVNIFLELLEKFMLSISKYRMFQAEREEGHQSPGLAGQFEMVMLFIKELKGIEVPEL